MRAFIVRRYTTGSEKAEDITTVVVTTSSGLELRRKLRQADPGLKFSIVTADVDPVDVAVEKLKAGVA